MARMECFSASLSNGFDPNDVQLRVYSDREFKQKVLNKPPHLIERPDYDVWKCPECERLYFLKDDLLEKLYILERR
jgi:hypothetical protein